MSLMKINNFSGYKIWLAIFSLLFVASCGKEDSKQNNPEKTETAADVSADSAADNSTENTSAGDSEKKTAPKQ